MPSFLSKWFEKRNAKYDHKSTLDAYKKGEYPSMRSIDLGVAYQEGLLDAVVLCKYSWLDRAFAEGPVFLEAWRSASRTLQSRSSTKLFCPYSTSSVLAVALGLFDTTWTGKWSFLGTSPALSVVLWVHTRDPTWCGNHLSEKFYASGLTLWDAMLYRDVETSAWAMTQWPDRYASEAFPWKLWLENNFEWLYSLSFNSYNFPAEKWWRVVDHMAQWSPFNEERTSLYESRTHLSDAMALVHFSEKPLSCEGSIQRGLVWHSLTRSLPPELTHPIGASLGLTWPGMHPTVTAIARHFYPDVDHAFPAPYECKTVVTPEQSSWYAMIAATLFLHESPRAWCDSLVASWFEPACTQEQHLPLPNLEWGGSMVQ